MTDGLAGKYLEHWRTKRKDLLNRAASRALQAWPACGSTCSSISDEGVAGAGLLAVEPVMATTARSLLLACWASSLLACATPYSAARPLDAAHAQVVQGDLEDERVTVYRKSDAPVVVRQVKLDPMVLQGIGGQGPRSVPVESISAVTWRSRGKGFARGAIAGAILGPLLGLVIGAALPPQRDQYSVIRAFEGGFIGLAAGPALCGGIGALIGVENRIEF
jgi:hypothetical protein